MVRILVSRRLAVIGVAVVSAVICLVAPGLAVARAWRIEALPGPQDAALAAVSCTPGCTAVGQIVGQPPSLVGATLTERGSLTGWSIQSTAPLPTLGDVQQPYLADVSCTSAFFCSAVGAAHWGDFSGDFGGESAIADRWNGRNWSLLISPTRNQESGLRGVSCTSPHACVAVGVAGVGPNCAGSVESLCTLEGKVERWNGRRWSSQLFPQRPAVGGSGLVAVSCTSAIACVAVGGTVAERWDGTRWSAQRIVKPEGFELAFTSVSCASATSCTAVGNATVPSAPPWDTNGQTYVEHWNGERWTHQLVPTAPSVLLKSVSCPTHKFCVAVGGLSPMAAVEVWNGRQWSIRSVPTPPGSKSSSFNGITCTLRLVCTAVGSFTDAAGTGFPLVERYS